MTRWPYLVTYKHFVMVFPGASAAAVCANRIWVNATRRFSGPHRVGHPFFFLLHQMHLHMNACFHVRVQRLHLRV